MLRGFLPFGLLLIFFFFFLLPKHLQLAEERKLMADAEAKFLRVDRVESAAFTNGKPKVPAGKTGSLLGIAEFWTEGDKVKTANGTYSPHPRSEMKPLKMPSIILPPSFKRKASAPVRPDNANETAQAQPVDRSDSIVPNGSEAKRSRTVVPNEVVRDNHTDKDFAKPRIRVSNNISGQAAQQEKSGKRKK